MLKRVMVCLIEGIPAGVHGLVVLLTGGRDPLVIIPTGGRPFTSLREIEETKGLIAEVAQTYEATHWEPVEYESTQLE